MRKKKKTKNLPVKKPTRLRKKISNPPADKQLWTEWLKTFDSISDWISVIDIQSNRILFSNAESKNLLGTTAKKIIGKRCCEIVHGSKTPKAGCPAKKMLATHKRESMELLLPAKNQWLMITVDPIKDNGKITRFVHIVRDITKQKKVEHDLAESKGFLNSIFSSIPDGISILNEKMEIVGVNTAMEKWYSHVMPLVGKKCYQAYHGRTKSCDICPSRQTLRTGKPAREVVPKTGKQKKILGWQDLYSFPWYDSKTGKLNGVIEYVRDITERKKAENEIAKFKFISDNSADAHFLLGRDAKFQYVNKAACKMFGYSEEELIKLGVTDVDIVYDRKKYKELFDLIQHKTIPSFETMNKRKDGSIFPTELTVTGYKIGGTPYMFTALRDITERRKMEEALRASEEKFKALSEQSITGTCLIQDGKFAYVNPRLADILGFTQETMTGLTVLDLVAESDRDLVKENMRKRMSGELSQIHYTFTALKKDGSEIQLEVHGSRMLYNEGPAIIATLLDITERTKTENALREAKNEIEQWSRELEERVNKKTAELEKSVKQLIQSEKLAAMGRLSAGLAHELNSPLAGLLPLLDKYRNREKEGTNEFREMTLMLKACEHMAMIVRDFSAFSRRPSEERTRLNINDVIESTLSFTAGPLEKKEIKIIRQYGEPLPDILGNKTELQQVLINLLTNARDAMPNGGQITIKTLLSADKENVIMEFIDTGTGIEKENLNKILDPFFTTKGIAEGTGLGLTVSYGIIKNHEGHISITSKPGKGAKFTISLPAIKYHEGKDINN